MDKIQLIFFFISGFLLSRLVIKTHIPQRIIVFLLGEKHLPLSRIILYLVAVSAGLSFFIPNAITVLTLLPVLELLRETYQKAGNHSRDIPTLLALSTIYGANIGGMGSITATPANGILVTFAELNRVAGREHLTFAGWLAWGIPLVIVFVLIAWLVLVAVFRPGRRPGNSIRLPFRPAQAHHPHQKIAFWLTSLYFVSSLLLSLLIIEHPGQALPIVVFTAILTLLFIAILFRVPFRIDRHSQSRSVLLTIPDCYSNLPMRGFLFVGIAIVLAGILYLFHVDQYFARWIGWLLPTSYPVFALFLVIALITSFSTEVLSNTAVQVSMFLIMLPLSHSLEFPLLLALILITLSSTSAFMSPIATGVNGLAFGGVRGVSLTRMLLVGFLMNIAGALLISGWMIGIVQRLNGG